MAYKGEQTYYEWGAEQTDEHSDIIDCTFVNEGELAKLNPFLADGWELVLVRNVGSDSEGIEDRQWAYPVDGKLPEFFDGGAKVPARFVKEWATRA